MCCPKFDDLICLQLVLLVESEHINVRLFEKANCTSVLYLKRSEVLS